jgi:hypothetical protein
VTFLFRERNVPCVNFYADKRFLEPFSRPAREPTSPTTRTGLRLSHPAAPGGSQEARTRRLIRACCVKGVVFSLDRSLRDGRPIGSPESRWKGSQNRGLLPRCLGM